MDDQARFILSEIPDVETIVENECWLAAERCGHPVDYRDPAIQQRVADIILKGAGSFMRKKHSLPPERK